MSRDTIGDIFGDQDRVGLSRGQIVAFQRTTYATCLDANNRIGLRIERGIATENFQGDRISLNALRPSGQRFLDDVTEKLVRAIGNIEVCTLLNAAKLNAHSVRARRRR